MTKVTFAQAHQKVWSRQLACVFLYIGGHFAGHFLVPLGGQTSQEIRFFAAMLQIVPILLYIAFTARFFRETDDYMRQIGYEALAFASGWTVVLVAILAPLQQFELIPEFPKIVLLVVFQIAAVCRFAVLVKKPNSQKSNVG